MVRDAERYQSRKRRQSDMVLSWLTAVLVVLVVGTGALLYAKRMDKSLSYEVAETRYMVITAHCNVRAGAGTSFAVVGSADQGDRLSSAGEAVQNASGAYWYEVQLKDGTIGWVSESVVSVL